MSGTARCPDCGRAVGFDDAEQMLRHQTDQPGEWCPAGGRKVDPGWIISYENFEKRRAPRSSKARRAASRRRYRNGG